MGRTNYSGSYSVHSAGRTIHFTTTNRNHAQRPPQRGRWHFKERTMSDELITANQFKTGNR
jgi:hypothetical protein